MRPGRAKGLFAEFHHNYSSFLPAVRWRDFCLLHCSAEWNHEFGHIEWTIAVLGFWYRGTYVYNNDTPAIRRLNQMLDDLERDRADRGLDT